MAANAYRRSTEELHAATIGQLVCVVFRRYMISLIVLQEQAFRHTVLEPVGKMAAYFPNINTLIEKRNKKVRWWWS